MISKFKKLFFLIFFLSVFPPYHSAFADTGPKPTMDFTFAELGGLTITSGILYECDQSDCSDAEPIREIGPQRLRCEPGRCRALAYGFAPYNKLEIVFSDGKTRTSNIFEPAGFDSFYKVTVRGDDLLVEAQFNGNSVSKSPVMIILVVSACALVIGGLLTILTIFLARRSRQK